MSDHDQGLRPIGQLQQLCKTRWCSRPKQSKAWSGTAASLFFQLLPAEIRRQIYGMVVYLPSVHIDLLYGQPPGMKLHQVQSQRQGDMPKSAWHWLSSVCHCSSNNDKNVALGSCPDPHCDSCNFERSGISWYETCSRNETCLPPDSGFSDRAYPGTTVRSVSSAGYSHAIRHTRNQWMSSFRNAQSKCRVGHWSFSCRSSTSRSPCQLSATLR